MATGVQALPVGIVDAKSIPALSKFGPNSRVSTATAPIGVVGDTVTFPPLPAPDPTATATGTWTLGSSRVFASGAPVVTTTALSVTVLINGAPGGPMRVQFPDPRVSAS